MRINSRGQKRIDLADLIEDPYVGNTLVRFLQTIEFLSVVSSSTYEASIQVVHKDGKKCSYRIEVNVDETRFHWKAENEDPSDPLRLVKVSGD